MQDLATDNGYFLYRKTRDCRSKGKDKVEITAVPLDENRMQTRINISKQIGSEKKEKTPTRRKRKDRMKS